MGDLLCGDEGEGGGKGDVFELHFAGDSCVEGMECFM